MVKETSAGSKRRVEKPTSNLNRIRNFSIAGLFLGIALIILGPRSPAPDLGPALFLLGYTVFLISTGVASFITIFKMLYPRAQKKKIAKAEQPRSNLCPRCKGEVEKGRKFCSNCGKQISVKS